MSSASEVLVVILSIVLAIFLILAIVLAIYMIALTRQIRKLTASAEKTVDNIQEASSKVNKAISPMIIAEIISKFINKIRK